MWSLHVKEEGVGNQVHACLCLKMSSTRLQIVGCFWPHASLQECALLNPMQYISTPSSVLKETQQQQLHSPERQQPTPNLPLPQ